MGDAPSMRATLLQRAEDEARLQPNAPDELPPLPFPVSLAGYRVTTGRLPGTLEDENTLEALLRGLCQSYDATLQVYLPPHVQGFGHRDEVPLDRRQAQRVLPDVLQMGAHLGRRVPRSLLPTHPMARDLCRRGALWVRDACLVRQAQRLIVFGTFVRPPHHALEHPLRCWSMVHMEGQAGRVVQLAIDHNRRHPRQWKEVWAYDLPSAQWFELKADADGYAPPDHDAIRPFLFLPMVSGDTVPLLHRRTAVVVGPVTEAVRTMVRYLFRRSLQHAFHARTAVTTAYEAWVTRRLMASRPDEGDPMPAVPLDIPVGLLAGQHGPTSMWVWVWPHGWLRRRPEPSEGWSEAPCSADDPKQVTAYWYARWEPLQEWLARCQRVEAWVMGSSDEEEEEDETDRREVLQALPQSIMAQYYHHWRRSPEKKKKKEKKEEEEKEEKEEEEEEPAPAAAAALAAAAAGPGA